MQSWSRILEAAEANHHVVQFYGGDEQLLTRHVSSYVGTGLRLGEGVLMVATREHSDAIFRRLRDDGLDPDAASREGQLHVLDAAQTLAKFLVDGRPDWSLFQSVISSALAAARQRAKEGKVRAFGEMVGLLWEDGERASAILLEEYWNRLLARERASLFCAYPVDAFGADVDRTDVNSVMAVHTHVCAGPKTLFSNV